MFLLQNLRLAKGKIYLSANSVNISLSQPIRFQELQARIALTLLEVHQEEVLVEATQEEEGRVVVGEVSRLLLGVGLSAFTHLVNI